MTAGVPIGELVIGQEIPRFRRTTGPLNWARFAAVNDEFLDIHLDDDAGRRAHGHFENFVGERSAGVRRHDEISLAELYLGDGGLHDLDSIP